MKLRTISKITKLCAAMALAATMAPASASFYTKIHAEEIQLNQHIVPWGGSAGTYKTYYVEVPASEGLEGELTVTMSGLSYQGDMDLSVNYEDLPTYSDYLCDPSRETPTGSDTSNETCVIKMAKPGKYYIAMKSWDHTYSIGMIPRYKPAPPMQTATNGIDLANRETKYWKVEVPAGQHRIAASAVGFNNENINVMIRRAGLPEGRDFDCSSQYSNIYGHCEVSFPTAGTYYIAAYANGGTAVYDFDMRINVQ